MIYVLRAAGSEFVKIGVSKGIGPKMVRISELQTGCPFELVLIAQADWPHIEERRIHARLKRFGLHVRGEWFIDKTETSEIIGLLRDGHIGLDAWHKRISYALTNRRLAAIKLI